MTQQTYPGNILVIRIVKKTDLYKTDKILSNSVF